MGTNKTGYKVSQRTAAYIDALKNLNKVHNNLLQAITGEEGEYIEGEEEQALKMIQPLEAQIWQKLEQSITSNLFVEESSAQDTI